MSQINIEEIYILSTTPTGPAWTWQNSPSGFHNKRKHAGYSHAYQSLGHWQAAIVHHIDPISAIVLGMMTIDELRGFYPSGFTALLDMLKQP